MSKTDRLVGINAAFIRYFDTVKVKGYFWKFSCIFLIIVVKIGDFIVPVMFLRHYLLDLTQKP